MHAWSSPNSLLSSRRWTSHRRLPSSLVISQRRVRIRRCVRCWWCAGEFSSGSVSREPTVACKVGMATICVLVCMPLRVCIRSLLFILRHKCRFSPKPIGYSLAWLLWWVAVIGYSLAWLLWWVAVIGYSLAWLLWWVAVIGYSLAWLLWWVAVIGYSLAWLLWWVAVPPWSF